MLDFCLYMVGCSLLGCFSCKNQVRKILFNPCGLTKPWLLEKLIFYTLLEIIKILTIIFLGIITNRFNFILTCSVGMILYLTVYTINFSYPQSYLVLCFWLTALVLHPQTLQISLAVFLSCYMLTKSKSVTSYVASLSFPLSLIITSANMELVLFSMFVLLFKGAKNHWSKIKNILKTVTFSLDFNKL